MQVRKTRRDNPAAGAALISQAFIDDLHVRAGFPSGDFLVLRNLVFLIDNLHTIFLSCKKVPPDPEIPAKFTKFDLRVYSKL